MSIITEPFRTRVVAFYLPQYHPIPENDEWWGKGFTEWTNVARARRLFPGHDQPRIPAELGYYDLRVPESREAQADLAREHGIHGFCYYHYWFGGKRLLERPFLEVLKTGKPQLPFCLCWANQTWTGVWHGCPERVLIEQTYPGRQDHERHFAFLQSAFADSRYIHVEGKPLFLIFDSVTVGEPRQFTDALREQASRSGLKGLFLVAVDRTEGIAQAGFDAGMTLPLKRCVSLRRGISFKVLSRLRRLLGWPRQVFSYREAVHLLCDPSGSRSDVIPCVLPNWDNSPRTGRRGIILHGSTPELFRTHLRDALAQAANKPSSRRLLFVKSWNEWAEGNYLEPDQRFGRAYLRVIADELNPGDPPPVQGALATNDGRQSA